jgi:hypothetical protein
MIERITFDPNQCGGRPCIRGLRIQGEMNGIFLAVQSCLDGAGSVVSSSS